MIVSGGRSFRYALVYIIDSMSTGRAARPGRARGLDARLNAPRVRKPRAAKAAQAAAGEPAHRMARALARAARAAAQGQ